MQARVTRKARKFFSEVTVTARRDGPVAAASLAVRKVTQALVRIAAYVGELIVDQRFGMVTRGIDRNELALREAADLGDANHYQAISLKGFREVVTAAATDPGTTAFVDLGAGRGRALVLGAELGFVEILGVELDPALTTQAARNLARWRERNARRASALRLEVRNGDAAQVVLPDLPVLLFLYNSFGPATLKVVLDRIVESYRQKPRPIVLCYFNPVHADVVEAHSAFSATVRSDAWVVYSVAGWI